MYIGTSLSKCLKSILSGEIAEKDVFFIVSNTWAPNVQDLESVVREYHDTYYGSVRYGPQPSPRDFSEFPVEDAIDLAIRLREAGKLHQPRCVTSTPCATGHLLQDTWYEIVPKESITHPDVLEAYNKYRVLSELAR